MNFEQFLYWEQTNWDTIGVKKIYIDLTGDLIAGILLSQIIYWHLPNKEGQSKLRVKKGNDIWLAKGRSDWWEECRISEKQFDRAIKVLEDLGIVEKKLFRFNGHPTIHVRLQAEKLMILINEYKKEEVVEQQDEIQEEQKDDSSKEDPILPKGQNGFTPKGEMDFTQRSKTNLPKGENGFCPNSKMDFTQKVKTLTETTTKTTTEITNSNSNSNNTKEQKNVPYEKIKDLYNEICISLPNIRIMSERRKKHVKARWLELGQDIAVFEDLFRKVEESDWCTARKPNYKGEYWRNCNFDWIIGNDNNAAKILEGTYDNKEPTTTPQANYTQKPSKFVNFNQPNWDFDELERLEQERIDRELREGENGQD